MNVHVPDFAYADDIVILSNTLKQLIADQGPPFVCTASLVAKAIWRPTEDVGHDTQGRPGTSLWSARLPLRTTEKGMGERFL